MVGTYCVLPVYLGVLNRCYVRVEREPSVFDAPDISSERTLLLRTIKGVLAQVRVTQHVSILFGTSSLPRNDAAEN